MRPEQHPTLQALSSPLSPISPQAAGGEPHGILQNLNPTLPPNVPKSARESSVAFHLNSAPMRILSVRKKSMPPPKLPPIRTFPWPDGKPRR